MPVVPSPLPELLVQLEAAVRDGSRYHALEIARQIERRLAGEAADGAAIERQVRALLARLEGRRGQPSAQHKAFTYTLGPVPERTTRGGEPNKTDVPINRVWFATNRKPEGDGFGNARHRLTTLGVAHVAVPEHRPFGSTGSSFWQRLKRLEWRDDHMRLQSLEQRQRDAFFAEIGARLQQAREEERSSHALFFLHGFNTTFEEAAIRAAQLGVDLQIPATAFFSWPSRGSVAAYPADEATIEASEPAITRFLVDFAQNCGAEKVHVIAHSMGNRGLLRALQRIAANAETRGQVKFGQIFLAAPDVDRDLFLDLARLFPDYGERTTLYASDGDKAVHLSARLHDAPRAGYFTPYTVTPEVDTIAVPDFDVDLLGHGYFAQADALLHDIFDLMRHDEKPALRQRIRAALHDGVGFWRIRR